MMSFRAQISNFDRFPGGVGGRAVVGGLGNSFRECMEIPPKQVELGSMVYGGAYKNIRAFL